MLARKIALIGAGVLLKELVTWGSEELSRDFAANVFLTSTKDMRRNLWGPTVNDYTTSTHVSLAGFAVKVPLLNLKADFSLSK